MKKLYKGNEAIAEAAIAAGCRCFFGYPITPQNEIPEYMSANLSKVGGYFVQAESEVSAINMVYGAAGAGARAMTSSSSPGISLKQEGISYMACAQLPCLIVNMMRAGPGLGGIQSSQSDYFQAVKGGGHGDYKLLVYAPSSIQEAIDITYNAFDKADKYRCPVMILGDGMLGQMMEPAEMPAYRELSSIPAKEWATTGANGGKRRIINSLYIEPDALEAHTHELYEQYKLMEENEASAEEYLCDDAEIIIASYGIVSRISKAAIDMLREEGVKIGLIRPITLNPFPTKTFAKYANSDKVKKFISVELSMGQMIEDVKLATEMKKPVLFFGRTGGNVMMPEEIVDFVKKEGK